MAFQRGQAVIGAAILPPPEEPSFTLLLVL
jgi:hypothetical protein